MSGQAGYSWSGGPGQLVLLGTCVWPGRVQLVWGARTAGPSRNMCPALWGTGTAGLVGQDSWSFWEHVSSPAGHRHSWPVWGTGTAGPSRNMCPALQGTGTAGLGGLDSRNMCPALRGTGTAGLVSRDSWSFTVMK